MNVFADLSQAEYRQRALGYRADLRQPRSSLQAAPFLYEDTVPAKEVDWVKKGVVTEVGGGALKAAANGGVGCCRIARHPATSLFPGLAWPGLLNRPPARPLAPRRSRTSSCAGPAGPSAPRGRWRAPTRCAPAAWCP